jgi:hypothetical protein
MTAPSTDRDNILHRAALRDRRRTARALWIAALVIGISAAVSTVAPSSAEARPRPTSMTSKSNFEANKTFGLGLMLGAPTSLSGKYFVGRSTAIDFGIGTIYDYRDRRGLHLHADFLWHPVSLASPDAFELPLYFGIGGRFFDGDRCYRYVDQRGNYYCDYYYRDYTALGLRAPVGLSFDFNRVPLDIFAEIALVLDFLVDHDSRYDDGVYGDLNGAIGIRYYFN